MKTKIKSHGDEIIDFYFEEVPKLCSNHNCLAVVSLDSDLKKNDSYYPQVFLRDCKYVEKKVVSSIHINLCDVSYSFDE